MSNIVPFRPRSKQLSTFINACLEPLPDKVLTDTAYNSLVRQSRYDKWWEAENAVRFYRAYLGLLGCTESRSHENKTFKHQPANLPDRTTIVCLWRQAVADLLRTPVCRKSDIAWKRRQEQDLLYLPISREEFDAAIAADEAFIAAHPTKRKRGAS